MGDYGGTHTNMNGSNQNKKSRHNGIVQEMYHASESSTGYNNPSGTKGNGMQTYFNTRNQPPQVQPGVQPLTVQVGNNPSEFRNGQSVHKMRHLGNNTQMQNGNLPGQIVEHP